jgi:hypothetical protein
MRLGEVTVEGEFEVFDSGGSWAFLLGKPTTVIPASKHTKDTVSIKGQTTTKRNMLNEIKKARVGGDNRG